jgi:hypothetical protein
MSCAVASRLLTADGSASIVATTPCSSASSKMFGRSILPPSSSIWAMPVSPVKAEHRLGFARNRQIATDDRTRDHDAWITFVEAESGHLADIDTVELDKTADTEPVTDPSITTSRRVRLSAGIDPGHPVDHGETDQI